MHASKADVPIVVNVGGSVISHNDLHPLNVASSIVVTDSGILISLNDVHPLNAFWPRNKCDSQTFYISR